MLNVARRSKGRNFSPSLSLSLSPSLSLSCSHCRCADSTFELSLHALNFFLHTFDFYSTVSTHICTDMKGAKHIPMYIIKRKLVSLCGWVTG